MNKNLSFFIFTLIFTLFIGNHLFADTWYVYPQSYSQGDNSGSSPENAFQGLSAINYGSIQPGDTLILLADKGYFLNEVLTVTGESGTDIQPVLITSNESGIPVIDNGYAEFQYCSYYILDNITIQGSPFSAVIMKKDARNIIIKNCTLTTSGQGIGIETDAGDDNLIENCTIRYNQFHGIGIDGNICRQGYETIIRDCEMSDNGYHGIELNGNYYIVESNYVERNGNSFIGTSGIHIFAFEGQNTGRYNIVRYNFCNDNIEIQEDGFGPDGNGIQIDQFTGYNKVYYNICLDNDGAGISLLDTRNNEIYNNSCAYNYEDSAGGHVGLKFLAELSVTSLLEDTVYHCKNNIFKNNFTNSEDTRLAVGIDEESIAAGENIFSHNLYWNNDNNDIWRYGSLSGTEQTAWNNAASAYDYIDEPNWNTTDPEQAEDFKFNDNGIFINNGINVNLSRDYEGNPIIDPPSIGAYEYNMSSAIDELYSPHNFELAQNYPNPFNPVTKISYSLPNSSHVLIEIYNVAGQKVETIYNAHKKAGRHEIDFNAANLSSGIYFYRVQAGKFNCVKKMMLIK